MIRINKTSVKKWLYTLYIFCIIFCPPIMPHFELALTAISGFVLLAKYRHMFVPFVKQSKMNMWIGSVGLLASYWVMVPLCLSAFVFNDMVQTGNYISLFNRFTVLTVVLSVCGTCLFCGLKENHFSLEDFLKMMFWAGALEGFSSLLAVLSPGIKSVFVKLMMNNTGSQLYANKWYITVRAYGFAGTMVDLFGLGIAVLAGACFIYGAFKNKKYIFLSMIIAISTVLNSRTGLLLYICCIVGTILYAAIKGKIFPLLCSIIVICVVCIGFSVVLATDILPIETKGWIVNGINSVTELFSKGSSTTDSLGVLLQDSWWELPEGIQFVVGTGHTKYSAMGYSHSDVGYVNEIWAFGIVGAIFLYIVMTVLIFGAIRKNRNIIITGIGWMMIGCYFIFNIKCVVIGYNPGAVSLLLFVLGMYFLGERKTTNKYRR